MRNILAFFEYSICPVVRFRFKKSPRTRASVRFDAARIERCSAVIECTQ